MRPLSGSISDKGKESFVRKRDDPYFDGMRRVDPDFIAQGPTFLSQGTFGDRNSAASSSICDDSSHKQILVEPSEHVSDQRSKQSVSSVHLLETYERTLPGRLSKFVGAPLFSFPTMPSDSESNMDEPCSMLKDSMPRDFEADDEFYSITIVTKPIVEKRYSMNQRKSDLSKVPLPQSAASFYCGHSPQIEIIESCESIVKLNCYLATRRDDIRAGVPGMYLHAVIGPEAIDVGSATLTIIYAFYLNGLLKNSQLCTVPIINMKRAELDRHAELKWLLESCQIDLSSLIFIDEIDLSYYFQYGSLKLVLLNDQKLSHQQEALKEAVVEIFNCKQDSFVYPWVETFTISQDCSGSTLVAEKISMVSPEILAGKGFSRLLLAAILLDTGNLKNPQCTTKDKYMATLLINGAGCFGLNGLFQILRYKMHDVSELKVGDVLRKDFKKWTRVGNADKSGSRLVVSHIGMSSIGISVAQLLSHNDSAPKEVILFQQSERLRLLLIISGYYDSNKNFKREILVSAESLELANNLLCFLNTNASQLRLKVLHQSGLRDEMRAFEVDNMITSGKTIERLMEEFSGTSKSAKPS
ncbi:hypothetical protein Syun_019187 [Stephania yunnanensis]|uniref:DHHA2 domain-containing protein n=1 Tax=Stephania yunnanensis TaxID=152371 RepID=A0AAP0NXQ9_9MAGN